MRWVKHWKKKLCWTLLTGFPRDPFMHWVSKSGGRGDTQTWKIFLTLGNFLLLTIVYNSVQMFEAFQDRNPHFFGTVSLSWIVMNIISKTYSFSLYWTKPLRKIFLGQNLDFWKSYFLFPCWNWIFWTNMESNAALTLHFGDLAVQNYLFLKDVCIRW